MADFPSNFRHDLLPVYQRNGENGNIARHSDDIYRPEWSGRADFQAPSHLYQLIWGNETCEDREINLRGDEIVVLNEYVPQSSLNANYGPSFYLMFERLGYLATAAGGLQEPRIHLLHGRARIRAPYQKAYLNFRPIANFLSIVNNQFTFAYDRNHSTPIILGFNNILRESSDYRSMFKEYVVGVSSPLPVLGGLSNIYIRHGEESKRQIAIIHVFGSVVNPLQIQIAQISVSGMGYIESLILVPPAAGPQTYRVELPNRNAYETDFSVVGGGAGETTNMRIQLRMSHEV